MWQFQPDSKPIFSEKTRLRSSFSFEKWTKRIHAFDENNKIYKLLTNEESVPKNIKIFYNSKNYIKIWEGMQWMCYSNRDKVTLPVSNCSTSLTKSEQAWYCIVVIPTNT